MVSSTVNCEDLRIIKVLHYESVIDTSYLERAVFEEYSVAVGRVLVQSSLLKDLIQDVSSARRDDINLTN